MARSKNQRYMRCHGRNHHCPCWQVFQSGFDPLGGCGPMPWMLAKLFQLSGSLGGSACIAAIPFLYDTMVWLAAVRFLTLGRTTAAKASSVTPRKSRMGPEKSAVDATAPVVLRNCLRERGIQAS